MPFSSSRLPPDLTPTPLARLLEDMRARGEEIADLTESNPTRAGFEYPPGLLAPLSSPAGLAYDPQPFGLPATRAAVARELERRGLAAAPGDIVLTASTSEAYSMLFKLLCDPGDDVLVPRPSYPLFDHLTRLEGVEARTYPLSFHSRWTLDVGGVRHAMTPRTRAVLVVNPNNPTGSFVSREELADLASFCRERDLALIGDEVFGDYPIEAGWATSVLQEADTLTFSLGGLSKSAGLPQLKLGWIAVAGPADHVSRALTRLEIICDAYLSVSTPVQQAAPALLAAGADIRAQIAARVQANLRELRAQLSTRPACQVLPVEGGWYAVVRVPRLRTEEELVSHLLERHHILVHPGYFFDFPDEAFLVVSLLTRSEVFDPAIRLTLDVSEGFRS